MTTIIIQYDDLTADEAEEACERLSDMLGADVFLGLEDIKGWKIPTVEDWGFFCDKKRSKQVYGSGDCQMSLKSEAYKKDLGNPAYRNSEYWQEREKAEQRRIELKRKLKAIKAKKQANSTIDSKSEAFKGVKFCDTGLGRGVSMRGNDQF